MDNQFIVINYYWYGANGRIVSSYDKEKIKNLPYPVVYKVIEDLNKHTAIITIGIYGTEVFKPIIIDDNRFGDKEYMKAVDEMLYSMLQLSNKKGEKRWEKR